MDSMLRDVARYGTGAEATKRLGRTDIAGKTGTTNDAMDGWFSGYGGGLVAVAWMGYDEPRSLGGKEFGATMALPIWIDYMHVALAKRPQEGREAPDGVVRENDDWVYAEFAESPELKGIDLDQAPLPQNGEQQPVAGVQPGQAFGAAPAPGSPAAPIRPLPAATAPVPGSPAAPIRPLPPPTTAVSGSPGAPIRPLPSATVPAAPAQQLPAPTAPVRPLPPPAAHPLATQPTP
jgi:penicillin-binding protein 1A